MRKTERLDQVLIRLGYATPSEVEEAVARQRSKGGRFGSNMVELGAVTEEQLFDALVEQFRVPTIAVSEANVSRELLDLVPPEVVSRGLVIPVAWNEAQRVLSVAVANPSDDAAIETVRRAFDAKKVRISIAPESVLRDLVTRLGMPRPTQDTVRLVALPELFEPETAAAGPAPIEVGKDDRRILMITSGAARKNFLPPVLKPEGVALLVASNPDEAREALEGGSPEAVLVAPGMRGELATWVRKGLVPDPGGEILEFSSVSAALLDNPIPYAGVVQSLRGAVQALAEFRGARHGVTAPYGLMASDLEVMADRLGLRRIVADGLHIGLHLLMPVGEPKIDPFRAFQASLELAARIRFPWPIETLLAICQGLFVGRFELAELEDSTGEVAVAAQLLAVVWFRHNLVRTEAATEEEANTALRTSLRELAGRIASLEIIESYLDAISVRGGVDVDAGDRQVLLVGGDRIARALSPALGRVGCEPFLAPDVAEAQSTVEESDPVAIVIDHEVFGAEVERFGRVLKLGGRALLFVLTDSTDPALVLNLLDIGVDDVFGPPHDFDLVAARVKRAIRSRARRSLGRSSEPGRFSAAFDAFSFIDLAQMLSNGLKSVRVDLRRGNGEQAVLHLVNGRPVYASCGELRGPAAVYHVISWEDDGEFTVSESSDSPEQNITESTESLLMEGVRRLDESLA